MDLLSILNSKPLYLLVGVSLAIIFVMCIFFCRRAIKRARELDISDEEN